MDEVIYKQMAIDAVKGIGKLATLPDNDTVVRTSAVEYVLFNLPSAQSESEDITFWKKRAREYEEMVLKLIDEMARGIKINSVLITEEGIVFKKEKPEQRWIPCSKRLPKEEKKTYWVCTDTEYQCECRWTNNRFGLGEGEWGWSIFDTPQYSKPIAWMPLPEPYRKEGDEG